MTDLQQQLAPSDPCSHCAKRPVCRATWSGEGFGLCRECDAAEPAEGYPGMEVGS